MVAISSFAETRWQRITCTLEIKAILKDLLTNNTKMASQRTASPESIIYHNILFQSIVVLFIIAI
jgi:hypothetical protein